MSTILVLNENILAVDPIDEGDYWLSNDIVIPKTVCQGAIVYTVTLPDDYAPNKYKYDGSKFILVPITPLPIIIPVLTMRQARLALLDAGLLDEVEAAITTPENRIWWDYSTTVERNHPLVDAVLIALGKSPEEIDQMFIEAAKL